MPRPRLAVYWTPAEDHPLWRAGCEWLGRDPTEGRPVRAPASPDVGIPWRYGFHGTLMAPFMLVEGATEEEWLAAVTTIAARQRPYELPPLTVSTLQDFVALRPGRPMPPDHPLPKLAQACVTELERWRAPLSAADLARRLAAATTARQRAYVQRHGYPHVLADWRFHLTLSNGIDGREQLEDLRRRAERHFETALALPLTCGALSIFVETQPGAPFVLRRRVPFTQG